MAHPPLPQAAGQQQQQQQQDRGSWQPLPPQGWVAVA